MNVSLPPQMERMIREKVRSGQYLTEDLVILDALHLLDQRDRFHEMQLDELRKEVAIGIRQADRGEVSVYTEETLKELRQRITKR